MLLNNRDQLGWVVGLIVYVMILGIYLTLVGICITHQYKANNFYEIAGESFQTSMTMFNGETSYDVITTDSFQETADTVYSQLIQNQSKANIASEIRLKLGITQYGRRFNQSMDSLLLDFKIGGEVDVFLNVAKDMIAREGNGTEHK
eukprot:Awhi_evm1s14315